MVEYYFHKRHPLSLKSVLLLLAALCINDSSKILRVSFALLRRLCWLPSFMIKSSLLIDTIINFRQSPRVFISPHWKINEPENIITEML